MCSQDIGMCGITILGLYSCIVTTAPKVGGGDGFRSIGYLIFHNHPNMFYSFVYH